MSVRKNISLIGSKPAPKETADDVEWATFLDRIYPVGSIFMTVSHDTATKVRDALGGGTWVQWGKGRMPIGMGSNGTTNYSSIEATGGSERVTLTTSQMPKHSHGLSKQVPYGTPYNNTSGTSAGAGGGTFYGETYNPPWTVNEAGGSSSHENRPPYITVYMWKRTV